MAPGKPRRYGPRPGVAFRLKAGFLAEGQGAGRAPPRRVETFRDPPTPRRAGPGLLRLRQPGRLHLLRPRGRAPRRGGAAPRPRRRGEGGPHRPPPPRSSGGGPPGRDRQRAALDASHGDADVSLIGHSSGGLDATACSRTRASRSPPAPTWSGRRSVRSVVTVATPARHAAGRGSSAASSGQACCRCSRWPPSTRCARVGCPSRWACAWPASSAAAVRARWGHRPALPSAPGRLLAPQAPRRGGSSRTCGPTGRWCRRSRRRPWRFLRRLHPRPPRGALQLRGDARPAARAALAGAGRRLDAYAQTHPRLTVVLYRLAGGNPRDRPGRITAAHVAALLELRPGARRPRQRRHRANALPALGQAITAVWADHHDIIGHSTCPPTCRPTSTGWPPAPASSRLEFEDVWREVAHFAGAAGRG